MNMIEQFEDTLKHSDDNRRKLLYVMPAMLVGLILMALIYPDADNEINQQKLIQRDLNGKLQKNSIALLQQKIIANESRILKLKDKIYKVNDNIIQIQEKLKELDFIFYDDLGFANNIEKTLKSSKDLNLTLNYLKTTEPKKEEKEKSDSLIKLIKKVEIDGSGSFGNIVSFIQFIEGVNTLHNFEHLVIEIEEKKEDKTKDAKEVEGKSKKSDNKKVNIFFNFKINQYGVEL